MNYLFPFVAVAGVIVASLNPASVNHEETHATSGSVSAVPDFGVLESPVEQGYGEIELGESSLSADVSEGLRVLCNSTGACWLELR